MHLSSVDVAAVTDRGKSRPGNEDAVGALLHPSGTAMLLIVADGLGGLKDGAYASRLAVDLAVEDFGAAKQDYVEIVTSALSRASEQIFGRSGGDEARLSGTTIVAAILEESATTVLYAGDSRAYRFFNGALESITRDHSWVNEQVDAGLLSQEEADASLQRNIVTRCLGVEPRVELDRVELEPMRPGESYLLSSDGLHGVLGEAEMASLLHSRAGAGQIARDLVARANGAGGPDNISVVLARLPA